MSNIVRRFATGDVGVHKGISKMNHINYFTTGADEAACETIAVNLNKLLDPLASPAGVGAPWARIQSNKVLADTDKQGVKATAPSGLDIYLRDSKGATITLGNSADPNNKNKRQKFYFPYFLPEVYTEGANTGKIDPVATGTKVNTLGAAMAALGLCMSDGTALDMYIVPGASGRSYDIYRSDPAATDQSG